MHRAGDVRIENVADFTIRATTETIIRVTRAGICGSDLWAYNDLELTLGDPPLAHEAIGVVEDVGADVRTLKHGDVVIMPFAYSDGHCVLRRRPAHIMRAGKLADKRIARAAAERSNFRGVSERLSPRA